jgi:hypothetical protein
LKGGKRLAGLQFRRRRGHSHDIKERTPLPPELCRFIKTVNTKDLTRLGVPQGAPPKLGMEFIVNFIARGGDPARLEEEIAAVIASPAAFLGDPDREAFARALYEPAFKQREKLAPWRQWGSGLEPEAVKQMANACALPVAVAGALMPDAHVGYGLPIGGVLATDNAVILDIENHHNFAWRERHVIDGVEREVIVHRKGATPAGVGVLGIIPGSMASLPGTFGSATGVPASTLAASSRPTKATSTTLCHAPGVGRPHGRTAFSRTGRSIPAKQIDCRRKPASTCVANRLRRESYPPPFLSRTRTTSGIGSIF